MYLPSKLWTSSRHFEQKYLYFVLSGPEMEVQRSVKVSECTEINEKFTRGTHSTDKLDLKRLKSKL